jgi:hypothetical protein
MSTDRTTTVGLVVVGLAAAVLTFTTLFSLAVACGFSPWLAWLLPVTVDAAGLVALRIWLHGGPDFAKRLTVVCIAASVAGNATQHGLAAYGLPVPWWVIVVVSAVPPSMLAAVVHLAQADRPDGESPDQGRDAEPVQLEADQPDLTGSLAVANVVDEPVRGVQPAQTEPVREIEPGPVRPLDDPLLPEVVRWAEKEGVPSRNAVMKRFGVGTSRASRLLNHRVDAGKMMVS